MDVIRRYIYSALRLCREPINVMIDPDKITGRLGNRMFQTAFLIAFASQAKTDIWFQDQKWFIGAKDKVRKMFSDGITGDIDRVSIHVRRGDYVTQHKNFYYNLTETDYYTLAMAHFPDDKFLIFSDDIEWCKTRFLGERFEFSEGKSDVEDMNLMASCKHNIIANSSFSWWGAWLNPNPNKVVIGPKLWARGFEAKMPSTWILI